MIFFITATIFILVISLIIQKLKLPNLYNIILAYIWVFVLCGFTTYSADWEMYEWLHENNIETLFEPMFNFISRMFEHKDFDKMYMLYVAIYTGFYVLLTKIFTKNALLVSILYLPFVYLFYSTQIRYFMGYYAAFLGMYYFLVQKRYILSVILFAFALLNHSALMFVIFFIPIIKFVKWQNLLKFSLYSSLVVLFIIYFIVVVLNVNFSKEESKFGAYLDPNLFSGIFGGIFYFLPYIIFLTFVLNIFNKRYKENPEIMDNGKLLFLYQTSVIPLIFLFSSFFAQVYGHRFIVTGALFVILLFLNLKTSQLEKIQFYSLLIFLYAYIYVLPEYVMEETTLQIMKETLNSNTIFQKYFY